MTHRAVGLLLEASSAITLSNMTREDADEITNALRTLADSFQRSVERARRAAVLRPKVYQGVTAEGATKSFEDDEQAQFLMRANEAEPQITITPEGA